MRNYQNQITEHFRANLFAWIALHHFLPAAYLRELASCIVTELSANTLSLNDLFYEDISSGGDYLISWVIKSKKVDSELAVYLQDRIRGLAWSNDSQILNVPAHATSQGRGVPQEVESAIALGQVAPHINDEFSSAFSDGTSVAALASAVGIVCRGAKRGSSLPIGQLDAICSSANFPLSEFMRKHLGDLCVHSNDFNSAAALYQTAKNNLEANAYPEWHPLALGLGNAISQSLTLTKYFNRGPREASAYINQVLESSSIEDAPLLLINGSHDAMWLKIFSSDFRSFEDRRAAVLLPPLLLRSHNLSFAMEAWGRRKYQDAHRQFWSILRRQIAFGAIHEGLTTKAAFGRSIVNELTKDAQTHFVPDNFFLAVKFLIESPNKEIIETVDWSEDVVSRYVTVNFLEQCINFANEEYGVRVPRLMSLIELFSSWALALARHRNDLASKILTYLAELAAQFRSEFVGHINVGGQSLKAIGTIGRDRPEFRGAASGSVANAIVVRLGSDDHWAGHAEALKTAAHFVDVWDDTSLKAVVTAIVARLQRLDPAMDMWPVVRPALMLLMSASVKKLASADREMASEVLQTILRFGLGQRTEFASLLYYLRDFDLPDLALAEGADLRNRLGDVTDHVRQQAKFLNSSNAIENVNALLLAASFVGEDAINDALTSFVHILETAGKERRSISFSSAYSTLLLLAQEHKEIEKSLDLRYAEFKERLGEILKLVERAWEAAIMNPMVFTPFAFPEPTVPNTTLIFNWALASLRFAKAMAADQLMLKVLRTASTSNLKLADPIDRATAMLLALDPENLLSEKILEDSAEAFYAALGLRLASLREIKPDNRERIISALLTQVFRCGPRIEDLGVFSLATQTQLEANSITTVGQIYRRALEARPELRELLKPFFSSKSIS